MSQGDDSKLRRDIGFTGSAFLAFNGMIGAEHLRAAGARSTTSSARSARGFSPCSGCSSWSSPCRSRGVASHFPMSGGPVVYAAVFGPAASFQAGWIYYVARVTALAANANVFVTYLATLWPPLGGGVWRVAAIVAAGRRAHRDQRRRRAQARGPAARCAHPAEGRCR